ncbi:hypothetical protein Corgl_0036 [Coriobacterium glomerans PW2]|uniref:Tat pathway signal sequence domain protein n=1 Tax=Coriobacterium glomerans (strain ATCC 49209 / DSM 20642 / JCM 10262 / PW2) TaxID=700015 RepID=F2N6W6_CORGP|nr:hypothetical protein [Coriobacterium glomerans]AEB06165.1 hypothetical protein Corgl_0036 [Coriobacterium glomerans PW2]
MGRDFTGESKPAERGGITRRRFTLAGLLTLGAASAAGVLSGCSSHDGGSAASAGDPQVINDKSKIVSVIEDYDKAEAQLEPKQTWKLPLGTVLFHTEGSWAVAMLAPASAQTPNKLGALSLASGKMATLVDAPAQGTGYGFFDARCSDSVCAWVEMDFARRVWVLMAQELSAGRVSGDPVKLDEGDRDYEPARFTVNGSSVIWLHMPTATGKRSAENSSCMRWSVGEREGAQLVESQGRFSTQPRCAEGILTLTPRVLQSKGTYIGMTAYDLTRSEVTKVDQLILPEGVKPFEAVYMNERFAFSIEAAYDGVGALGKMGTFIGRAGDSYVFLEREPLACPVANGGRYLIKSQSSHFLIDTDAKTYATLRAPDRCLDFGDYPASEGATTKILTYATTRNDQGIPDAVTARLFSI